jgi:hypothetical protein
MKCEKRLAKRVNAKKDVHVLLLYQPVEKLRKHLLDKPFSEKAALLKILRLGKVTCAVKVFKKGPKI